MLESLMNGGRGLTLGVGGWQPCQKGFPGKIVGLFSGSCPTPLRGGSSPACSFMAANCPVGHWEGSAC